MLKQGIKTTNAEFIQTRTLSQHSFVQFRSYATLFPGLVLSLTLMSKIKKILETSLDLTPLFKTSIDTRVEGLALNMDYLGNRHPNFIQKKYVRKRRTHVSHTHTRFVLWTVIFIFVTPFYTPKRQKIINKAFSMQYRQFLLLFFGGG